VALSLLEIQALGKDEHITMHHCIQGWSGIAQWKGMPMKTLIDLVKPKPSAKTVAFFSFGEGLYGGVYYDIRAYQMLFAACGHPNLTVGNLTPKCEFDGRVRLSSAQLRLLHLRNFAYG
jgi:DMSO/TMAO reductase YedYZ molybdopterin-dependent catalytic subunit